MMVNRSERVIVEKRDLRCELMKAQPGVVCLGRVFSRLKTAIPEQRLHWPGQREVKVWLF